jgi:hypothetical protein
MSGVAPVESLFLCRQSDVWIPGEVFAGEATRCSHGFEWITSIKETLIVDCKGGINIGSEHRIATRQWI